MHHLSRQRNRSQGANAFTIRQPNRYPKESLLSRIREDYPVFRSAMIFGVLVALFYGLLHTPSSDYAFLQWNLKGLAAGSARILTALGYEAWVEGAYLRTPGFSNQIARGCDAIEPTALFICAVLASPVARWWLKIPGILIGGTLLLFVNTARIVTLYIIGIHYHPRIFDYMHEQVWQAAFIIIVFVVWAAWVQWALHPTERTPAG